MAVIDYRILDERRLTIEESRPFLGTNNKPADFTTVYRAVTRGNLLPNGQRVFLAVVRIGGAWVTSREAITRYVEALSTGWAGNDEPVQPPSKAEEARRLAEADRQLAAAGI